MFVIYYKSPHRPVRYFHPAGLQKTIKTAWALPERFRPEAEARGAENQNHRRQHCGGDVVPQWGAKKQDKMVKT